MPVFVFGMRGSFDDRRDESAPPGLAKCLRDPREPCLEEDDGQASRGRRCAAQHRIAQAINVAMASGKVARLRVPRCTVFVGIAEAFETAS